MDFSNFEINGIFIIPLLNGLAELLKKLGLDVKYIPLFNVIIGLALGIVFNWGNVFYGIIAGITIGLTASGLYDAVKYTKQILKT
jgi:hypothetical protein